MFSFPKKFNIVILKLFDMSNIAPREILFEKNNIPGVLV